MEAVLRAAVRYEAEGRLGSTDMLLVDLVAKRGGVDVRNSVSGAAWGGGQSKNALIDEGINE